MRPFLAVWALPVAYAIAFAGVRAFAVAFRPELAGNPAGTSIGRVVTVAGFHVHHVYAGAAIAIAAVAWALARRRFGVATLATLGVGLALAVDEVGLVASGFTEYNVAWRTPLALATLAVLVAVATIAAALGVRAGNATGARRGGPRER